MTGSPFLRVMQVAFASARGRVCKLMSIRSDADTCHSITQREWESASQTLSGNLVTRRRPTRLWKTEARLCLRGG